MTRPNRFLFFHRTPWALVLSAALLWPGLPLAESSAARPDSNRQDWRGGTQAPPPPVNATAAPYEPPAEPQMAPAEPTTAKETAGSQCSAGERHYRKSLLITAFPRRREAGTNAGRLWHAERELPALLGARLAETGHLTRYQLLDKSLPARAADAHRTQQLTRQLAREADTQLVLTGELEDMGMARPRDALDPGWLVQARNGAVGLIGMTDWDSRQRHLALTLRLVDGVTGQTRFERRFALDAVWNPEQGERARFGTPDFWDTDYGQALESTMAQAADELAEAIRCQPLVARLEPERIGAPRLLEAGRVQGVREGDQLPLYRLSQRPVPGQYRQYRARLLDSGARLTVVRVHDHYSEVRLEGEPRLYGEHLAITPGAAPEPQVSYRPVGR